MKNIKFYEENSGDYIDVFDEVLAEMNDKDFKEWCEAIFDNNETSVMIDGDYIEDKNTLNTIKNEVIQFRNNLLNKE